MDMKALVLFSALCISSITGFAFSQGKDTNVVSLDSSGNALRRLNHHAFQPGEKLEYVLHYGLINAGRATLEVHETPKTLFGRPLLHVVGIGKTLGAFNWFFKVRDRYESYIDRDGVFPWLFVRRVYEGGYTINQDYRFYQQHQKVRTEKEEEHQVPAYVQDMFSAFYFARTLNFDTAEVGDIYVVETFLDNELFPLRIKYMGKETIKTRTGKYRCMHFRPAVIEGNIFKDDDDLEVWITDDKNQIPVLAEAKILVGSIKMELTGYEGLANPIAKED